MKKMKILKNLLTCIVLLYASTVNAQLDSTVNRHFIIAFDKKVIHAYNPYVRKNNETIKNKIKEIIAESASFGKLRKGDYISIVNYAIGNQNKIDEFARPCKQGNQETVWKEYTVLDELFRKDWDPLKDEGPERIKDDSNEAFSMQSAAKSFAVKAVYNKNGNKYANRTYLLMVTDDEYQGNDINKEYENAKSAKHGRFRASKEDFLTVNRDFSRNYAIDYLEEKPLSPDKVYKIILFEIKPNTSFSLTSVVEYPETLGMHRVKGGYTYCFEMKPVNKNYEPLKLMMHYIAKDDKSVETQVTANGINKGSIRGSSIEGDSITFIMRGWLLKKDTLYGATVLNPYDDSPTSMSHDLSVNSTINLKEEATVFGIPLTDRFWWFYPDNITKAAHVWQWILIALSVLVLLGIIAVYIKKRSLFVPENKDIKLTYK